MRFVNGHSGRAPDVKAKLSAAKKGKPLPDRNRAALHAFWDANRKPPFERFIAKVEKTPDCWLWRGALRPNGYGVLNIDNRAYRAHRFAYEHFVGPIPAGLDIRHSCHNRACVNPAHLSVGTRADNMRDMVEAGRWGDRQVHRGIENCLGKLTDDHVRAIRRDGRSLREIATAYSITPGYASSIRSGKARSDVAHAAPGTST